MNRTGRKNRAHFRLAVQERSIAPGGKHKEIVGNWDPHKKEVALKNDRILYWISQGAQLSDTVYNLLVSNRIIKGKKRSVKIVKKGDEKKENSK